VASIPPHIHTQPSEAESNPQPDPNQGAIDAIRLPHSPVIAILGVVCSLAGLGSLWFGASVAPVAACLGAAGIVLSVAAWRSARKGHRPAGVAVAGLLIGVVVVGIVVVLAF
jgi:hypothetical protein